ncbi:hypothetical protein HDU96_008819 [Phlyctochytrium bullatum]|nr:hypothetical protein HDU96_008819 [Phlyctochytrium bullatum]
MEEEKDGRLRIISKAAGRATEKKKVQCGAEAIDLYLERVGKRNVPVADFGTSERRYYNIGTHTLAIEQAAFLHWKPYTTWPQSEIIRTRIPRGYGCSPYHEDRGENSRSRAFAPRIFDELDEERSRPRLHFETRTPPFQAPRSTTPDSPVLTAVFSSSPNPESRGENIRSRAFPPEVFDGLGDEQSSRPRQDIKTPTPPFQAPRSTTADSPVVTADTQPYRARPSTSNSAPPSNSSPLNTIMSASSAFLSVAKKMASKFSTSNRGTAKPLQFQPLEPMLEEPAPLPPAYNVGGGNSSRSPVLEDDYYRQHTPLHSDNVSPSVQSRRPESLTDIVIDLLHSWGSPAIRSLAPNADRLRISDLLPTAANKETHPTSKGKARVSQDRRSPRAGPSTLSSILAEQPLTRSGQTFQTASGVSNSITSRNGAQKRKITPADDTGSIGGPSKRARFQHNDTASPPRQESPLKRNRSGCGSEDHSEGGRKRRCGERPQEAQEALNHLCPPPTSQPRLADMLPAPAPQVVQEPIAERRTRQATVSNNNMRLRSGRVVGRQEGRKLRNGKQLYL